ncbi:MAG: winged helix DNA-binding domain-containing protein [Candidatus Geothermarchaeales archaeon]
MNWTQVRAWRLARHHLLERVEAAHLLEAVSDVCGVHAQLMSSAELSIWARVQDVTPERVQNALWKERSLVKTWAMRGTLHLLPASDMPYYVAASRTRQHYLTGAWLRYHGVTEDEIEAVIEAMPRALDGRRLTREQLVKEVVGITGLDHLDKRLMEGWGALLKPAAYHGHLCFGPSEGQNVTFVRPNQWLNHWREVDSTEGLKEVARRYLTAYGPATREDFARWWGVGPRPAQDIIESLEGEVEQVNVEGQRVYALSESVEGMVSLSEPESVRLLPRFDQYVVAAYLHCEYLLAGTFKDRVYRPNGWVSPVLILDGRIAGVWTHERRASRISLQVEPFEPLTSQLKERIGDEAERFGDFLGSAAEVSYS